MENTTEIPSTFTMENNVTLSNDVHNYTSDWEDTLKYQDYTFWNIYMFFRFLQGLITILVNVLTICAILKYKKVGNVYCCQENNKTMIKNLDM